MKYTLLDLVQTILSSMDSDEVNSIGDNVESEQVARLIRTTYFDIISRANLPENYSIFSLEDSNDPLKPTLMTIPSGADNIKWIKYNCFTTENTDPNFKEVKFLSTQEFFKVTDSFHLEDTNVDSFTHTVGNSPLVFLYKNDKDPTYYTSFDDSTLIFDSFDSTKEDTLQRHNTKVYGLQEQTFYMEDNFIPQIDEQLFPLLLNESKALAFAEMKQVSHNKAEKSARKGWISLQKYKDKLTEEHSRLPNYGRK